MKPINVETAAKLMHFDRGGMGNDTGTGKLQLEGAVALHNMLLRNNFAYLADEVGMGKTYVALGTAALLRHFNPSARIMVLTPRENIQRKWIKELRNFVGVNWQVVDQSVRRFDGRPLRESISCGSLADLARECTLSQHQDLFLRMTSFSPQFGGRDDDSRRAGRSRARDRLCAALPHLPKNSLDLRTTFDRFRDEYGQLINAVLPPIDLLIVDEAHNYKHGYHRSSALRNHLTALVFGRPPGGEQVPATYGKRVRRLLLLSATPFEYDYRDLHGQLDVFGFGDVPVVDPEGGAVGQTSLLADSGIGEPRKRELVRQFMIRRVAGLKIGGEVHTKNMYRREWRQGGLDTHDQPMAISDPKHRLIVALVQKKVAEVLGSERFNNRFQIGMLSSFESFLQSATHADVRLRDERATDEDDDDPGRVFDGDQAELEDEVRKGIDARPLAKLLRSYQREFNQPLPHPKLDATVGELARAFGSATKTLVFVRRLATMDELAARLNDKYDSWLQDYMRARLPGLEAAVDEQFGLYRQEKRGGSKHGRTNAAPVEDAEIAGQIYEQDEDSSGSETFFAWFFRGKDTRGVLSGAAFQKNRLLSPSSVYATLFEDDHVAMLLGRNGDLLGKLAAALGRDRGEVAIALRGQAFARFAGAGRKTDGYPRLHVLEAYQFAALRMLEGARDAELGRRARTILQEAYAGHHHSNEPVPAKFPGPEHGVGITTFVTLLHESPELRERLLPDPTNGDFAARFNERERRRELLSALSRLGSSYIDLYLLAIHRIGKLELAATSKSNHEAPEIELARDFLGLLEQQLGAAKSERPQLPGFHAFHELTGAAEAYHDIMTTNFPGVRDQRLWELRREFSRVLQNQSPVATSSRSKVKRLVQQFRMPGYPLVLVSTDILQEGEDLHTFCARVMHYGITWTPSGMEQRTGRVDRIGSLTQRRLDNKGAADPEHKIQIYYPHLQDTVEVLQVERVLARLNRFMTMIHSNADLPDKDARRIDAAREMVCERPAIEPIMHRLESAFDIEAQWLRGEDLGGEDLGGERGEPVEGVLEHFGVVWAQVLEQLGLRQTGESRRVGGHATRYEAQARDEAESHPLEVEIVPQRAGRRTLLRITVNVGNLDLGEAESVNALADLQRGSGAVKVCVRDLDKRRGWLVWLEREMLFHPETSQMDEVVALVRDTLRDGLRARRELADGGWLGG